MKLPRDLSGQDLAKKLKALGYEVTRQSGSHIRMTTQVDGQHHVTVPAHDPKAGFSCFKGPYLACSCPPLCEEVSSHRRILAKPDGALEGASVGIDR